MVVGLGKVVAAFEVFVLLFGFSGAGTSRTFRDVSEIVVVSEVDRGVLARNYILLNFFDVGQNLFRQNDVDSSDLAETRVGLVLRRLHTLLDVDVDIGLCDHY